MVFVPMSQKDTDNLLLACGNDGNVWYDQIDAKASALTLARLSMPSADDTAVAERAAMIIARMTGRGHFVGSSPATAPLIRDYLVELLQV